MFEFLNLALLGGLAAVAAPVLIHLSHRRKVKQVPWGAMRFLLEMLAKSRRRLLLDELLLLFVRILVLLLLALALIRPALKRGTLAGDAGLTRQGRTAAVLLIDDSLSTSAGRSRPVMEALKGLALAYLATLEPGDEVSLITRSQLASAGTSDPVYDLEAVRSMVGQIRSSAIATDMPALLEAGLAQLGRHINPGAEIVLIYDGHQDGWRADERQRWDELRARLRGPRDAHPGSRQRPHLIVLSPPADAVENNLAVSDLRVDRTLVAAGQTVGVRVQLTHQGPIDPRGLQVRLLLDGRPAGERLASIAAGGHEEMVFPLVFAQTGSHAVEAVLENVPDSLPADNRRALAVQVEVALPVLLVEGRPGAGFESSLGFVAAALDPEAKGQGPFRVTRLPVTQLSPPRLAEFRVIVLGDVAGLDTALVEALERFVVSGGGVLVSLGSQTDREFVNRSWARGGNGFLPCPLGPLAEASPGLEPVLASAGHPVFSSFGSKAADAWKETKVRRWHRLEEASVKSQELDTLLQLGDGSPLIVERRRGLGLVTLVATSLNGQWTDLPIQAVFVPLIRGLVGHLGSFVMPPRNLAAGERLTYTRPNQPGASLRAEDPAGRPFALNPGVWEGRQALISDPLLAAGVYTLRDDPPTPPVRYAVRLAGAESELRPHAARDVAAAFGETPVHAFRAPDDVARALDPAHRRSVELWRWLVILGVGMLFLETWLAQSEK